MGFVKVGRRVWHCRGMPCVLCDIADGHETADVVYEDRECMGVSPLRLMAPVHVLLFPRAHFADLPTFLVATGDGAGRLMRRAVTVADDLGLGDRGYRLAWNFGPDTGQRIMHPHLHLLGGSRLVDQLG